MKNIFSETIVDGNDCLLWTEDDEETWENKEEMMDKENDNANLISNEDDRNQRDEERLSEEGSSENLQKVNENVGQEQQIRDYLRTSRNINTTKNSDSNGKRFQEWVLHKRNDVSTAPGSCTC